MIDFVFGLLSGACIGTGISLVAVYFMLKRLKGDTNEPSV